MSDALLPGGGRPVERREVLDLIRRLEAADAGLGYTEGPRSLPAAVGREMGK